MLTSHVATFAKQCAAVQALAKAGARLDLLENDRYDAVTIASVANDEESLRLLLTLGASAKQVTSRYDGTALIAAAHLGHAGVVRQLIAAGAPLDHVNNLHWTAAIEAVVRTPLQLARARGYGEMVRILEAAGAR